MMQTVPTKNHAVGRKAVSFLNFIYPPILLIGLLLVIWQTMCTVNGVPMWMLAKPTDIASVFFQNTQELLPHIGVTYFNIIIGFLLSVIIGIGLAILISSFPTFGSAVTPIIVALCCVPVITLVPMLMLVFGLGSQVKIITIVIQAFPLVNMNAATAFLNVDPTKLELMKSLKASRVQQFRYCILKDALPGVFTGIKLAAIMSMLGGITAEMTGGSSGIGAKISYFMGFSKTPEALSCILYIVFLGVLLYGGVCLLEKLLVKGTK